MSRGLIINILVYVSIFIMLLMAILFPNAISVSIFIIGSEIFLILMIYLSFKKYKFEYFFLGKDYSMQINKYKAFIKEDISEDELKELKDKYRKDGIIFDYIDTKEGYFEFLISIYDRHKLISKDVYLLYLLCVYLSSGDGLEFLFNYLKYIGWNYDMYYKVIKESNVFDDNLKKLLLNKELKELFNDKASDDLYLKFDKKLEAELDNLNNLLNILKAKIYKK